MLSAVKKRLLFVYSAAIKRPLVSLAIFVLVVLGVWFFAFRDGNSEQEILVVQAGEFVQEVSVSGKVVAAQNVDLAFGETGRVQSVRVTVGDRVSAGQTLATLAIDVLAADLRAAEVDLEEARKEQATLVASAYRDILSEGLAAVPGSSSYAVTAPEVTGLYNGPEGVYKIRIVHGVQQGVDDHELRTFGLETLEPIDVPSDEPAPLGTYGLFVFFPDDLNEYDETTWYITIPNTKSSSYLPNYNAYQEALRTRDKALASAQATVSGLQTAIAERTLRAPFGGIVTAIDIEVGGVAATNEPAISLIGNDTLQIESFVPEINLSLLRVGEEASVTLDAYGAEEIFNATVAAIDPAETVRDGVSTYRTILKFTVTDPRVKSGMTANVTITAERRQDVISIPQGVVTSRDGKKFVRVLVVDEVVEREVTTGSVSSLGSIEITSGLSSGDVVVLSD